MARALRVSDAGYAYHVLNRRAGKQILFDAGADYAAFEKVLQQGCEREPMRLLAYILMPNHWHLILWPTEDGQLSRFMQWLTVTHMRRWHAHRGSAGMGPVYQGRFKSFPMQQDEHFLTVCRYVERNALRARLVRRAEQWRWCSLYRRVNGEAVTWLGRAEDWPVSAPEDWVEWVNEPQTEQELEAVRRSVRRGTPFGSETWQKRSAKRLNLESTLRDPWRPRKLLKK